VTDSSCWSEKIAGVRNDMAVLNNDKPAKRMKYSITILLLAIYSFGIAASHFRFKMTKLT
jgi:hypothetical protein